MLAFRTNWDIKILILPGQSAIISVHPVKICEIQISDLRVLGERTCTAGALSSLYVSYEVGLYRHSGANKCFSQVLAIGGDTRLCHTFLVVSNPM